MAPIKIRGFIFTHASGCVPRHAVLGVGVSNEVRGKRSVGPWSRTVECIIHY